MINQNKDNSEEIQQFFIQLFDKHSLYFYCYNSSPQSFYLAQTPPSGNYYHSQKASSLFINHFRNILKNHIKISLSNSQSSLDLIFPDIHAFAQTNPEVYSFLVNKLNLKE